MTRTLKVMFVYAAIPSVAVALLVSIGVLNTPPSGEAAAALVALCVGVVVAIIVPVFMGTGITGWLDESRKRSREKRTPVSKPTSQWDQQRVAAWCNRLVDDHSGIESKYIRELMSQLLSDSVEQLAFHGIRLRGEDTYLKYLIERLDRLDLQPGTKVRALCSRKTWDSPWVQRYWEANQRAVQRGIKIERVFLSGDERVEAAAAVQAEAGIEVHVVPRPRALETGRSLGIPADLGFTIITSPAESQVLIHQGLGITAEAIVFTSAAAVEYIAKLFERLTTSGASYMSPFRHRGSSSSFASGTPSYEKK